MSRDRRPGAGASWRRPSPLRRRRLLALLGGLSLWLAACQSRPPSAAPPAVQSGATQPGAPGTPVAAGPTRGGSVTIGLDQEPPTLDPHASPSAISFYIISSAGESLLYLAEDRQLRPWLAEAWEASDDYRTFTFKLRKDVTFQDGTPLDAAAVKWNLDRIVDPGFKAGSALTALTNYQGTDVVDDYTVRVTFSKPSVPFLVYAAAPYLAMVSPTASGKQGDQVNRTPVLSGPYRIEEWTPRDHVTLARWDGYTRRAPWADHDGPGYLERVIWKFVPEPGTRTATLESGETQIATVFFPQDLARLTAAGLTVASTPWVGAPLMMGLTTTRPPTDDPIVRQAINYAIDRDGLVKTLYEGTGTRAIGPLTAVMLDDPALRGYHSYDPSKAARLLDEAGWQPGPDGIRVRSGQRLEFSLNAIDYGSGPDQSNELIQGQLRQIGIEVKIKAQARPPWYEDNYHCAHNGMIFFLRGGDLDTLNSLYNSANVGTNFNWSCLEDPEVDRLLEQGRQEGDPTRRRQVYLQLEKKLMDMAVVAPLVDQLSVFVLRPNLSGLKFTGYSYPVITELSSTS